MTFLLAGILVGVLAAGWFGFERQRQVFEQLVDAVKTERDKSAQEAKVYRGLLLPALSRVEAAASEGASSGTADLGGGPRTASHASSKTAAAIPQKGANPRIRLRQVGTRNFLNEVRAMLNTPQKKTDALVAALEKQPVSKPASTPGENHV